MNGTVANMTIDYAVCVQSFVLSFLIWDCGMSKKADILHNTWAHTAKGPIYVIPEWNCAASFPIPTYLWAI